MPNTPNPPFIAGSITIPKQVLRWLDINPQGGPLRRTQSFVTVPAFSQVVNWLGCSDIVIAFNFEGPNNFSLINGFALPLNPNYACAISWKDQNNKVTRYWLWIGVGEVVYFDQILYSGQLIAKNFRIEVWSTNNTPAINTTAFQLYTSVLGGQDYRYGVDFALVNSDTPTAVFGNVNTAIPPLLSNYVPLDAYWNPNINVTVTGGNNLNRWGSAEGNGSFGKVSGTSVTYIAAPLVTKPSNCIALLSSHIATGSTSFSQPILTYITGLLITSGASSTEEIFTDNAASAHQIRYNHSTLSIEVNDGNGGDNWVIPVPVVTSRWYTVIWGVIQAGGTYLWVYDMSTGLPVGGGVSDFSTIGGVSPELDLSPTALNSYIILDVGVSYSYINNFQDIANWFTYTYFGNVWTLPLTFPANAVSQPNTLNYASPFNNRRNDTI